MGVQFWVALLLATCHCGQGKYGSFFKGSDGLTGVVMNFGTKMYHLLASRNEDAKDNYKFHVYNEVEATFMFVCHMLGLANPAPSIPAVDMKTGYWLENDFEKRDRVGFL